MQLLANPAVGSYGGSLGVGNGDSGGGALVDVAGLPAGTGCGFHGRGGEEGGGEQSVEYKEEDLHCGVKN